MGANRRPRAIGQFGWADADVGVECLRCGLATVYCDFAAARSFSERGWSVAADDAIRRFRCVCGSADLRFRFVAIALRPRPIPPRPAPLRPIYREDWRSLRRRGPAAFPDPAAIDAALSVLERAIHIRRYEGGSVPAQDVAAALGLLRPFCYRTDDLDALPGELDKLGALHSGHADAVLAAIRRQLGLPRREPPE